jgi:hypothetical protein
MANNYLIAITHYENYTTITITQDIGRPAFITRLWRSASHIGND